MLRYILFDLDNTLYPRESGLWEAIGRRINRYMIERLGIDPHKVGELRREYLRDFGTTLNALRHYHTVNTDDFLVFVHDLPLEKYLARRADLDGMLERLPLDKVIFSNADEPHVRRVLAQLGISRHFSQIIHIHALGFINKPDLRAYHKALSFISARAQECLFVDDSAVNLLPARELGMVTVLIGDEAMTDGIDHHIGEITDLEGVLAQLLSKIEK